jgi:hypothetical protein
MSDFTPKLPEVKFTKNGYEIRSDILALAQSALVAEYQYKFANWELTARKDEKTGRLIGTVTMPQFPGLEQILEHAEKMYSFVNQAPKK